MARAAARRLLGPIAVLCATLAVAPAFAQESSAAVPGFQELEAAGAVIGEIRVASHNVFDLKDPRENQLFYRFGNAIHVPTRPGVIRGALLFASGERVSVRLIEETERLLRGYGYLYDVQIRPAAYRDGVVDIEVVTRDSWSLTPALKLSRAGGINTGAFGLEEENFLGTALSVSLARESEVDRKGSEFALSHPHLFGSRVVASLTHTDYDDGKRDAVLLERPFYALDARWAAGLSGTRHSRVDSLYTAGTITQQYRREADQLEAYAGWSPGLVGGWARRYSVGLQYQEDTYRNDPALIAPGRLPGDQKLVAPFVRYELVQDDYREARNLDRVERPEYLKLGHNLRLQLGRAMESLGSSRDAWLYAANVTDGVALSARDTVLGSAYATGQYGSGGGRQQLFGAGARYFHRQRLGGVLYAAVAADTVVNGEVADQLLLGGDNGLRGYPLRYQTGTHRALLTVEQRLYAAWFPLRLFRVGAAAFVDHGRAWGGSHTNTASPGWLTDIGVGLRIFSDRSSSGRVLHIDLAFPLDRDPAIRSYQIVFKSRASF